MVQGARISFAGRACSRWRLRAAHRTVVPRLIVATPEKWDCVTRGADGEQLANAVRLLCIDEVS